MKRMLIRRLAVIAMLVILLNSGLVSAGSPPQKGGVLPEINLAVPKNPTHRNYLGLSGGGLFRIPQIKAEVVIIEIFSMYCPYCQNEAFRVNDLYQIIEKTQKMKGRVKLIGIGAGNTPFEVDIFRNNYKIPFPLFSDGDFSIHKSLGEVRTPYFIGIRIKDNGTHEVFYSKLGGFKEADDFLELMLKLSGSK